MLLITLATGIIVGIALWKAFLGQEEDIFEEDIVINSILERSDK